MEFVEEAAYRDACASGALPGVIFLAADKEGMYVPFSICKTSKQQVLTIS